MRPKETREVVDMIKRIDGGGSVDIATEINANSTNSQAAGAKAVYDYVTGRFPESPFPQPPAEPSTKAYIEDGTVITIDCAALKALLVAKDVDITGRFTTTSVCSETGGTIFIGLNEYEEPCINLESFVEDSKIWIAASTTFVTNDPIEVTTNMTTADVLDAFGTITLEASGISGLEMDFRGLNVSDLVNAQQELTLTAEEAASFITVTPPEPDAQ